MTFLKKLSQIREENLTPEQFLVEVLADSIGTGYSDWIDDISYDQHAALSFSPQFDDEICYEEKLAENAKSGTLFIKADTGDMRKYWPALWDRWLCLVKKDAETLYEKPLQNCDWALKDYLDESNDSADADAILQFWLFGEVIFG